MNRNISNGYKQKYRIQNLLYDPATTMFFAIAIFIIIFYFLNHKFMTLQNFINIGLSLSVLGILALGISIIAISGNFIDLSVGSNMALSGYVMAVIIEKLHLNESIGILCALLTGLVIGLVNATIIQKLKINSLITTLATMAIFRGLTHILSGGISISINASKNPIIKWLGLGNIFRISSSFVLFMILAIIFWIFYSKIIIGRNIYYMGNNNLAAVLFGINTDKYIYICFLISGLMASFCGVLLTARVQIISAGFAEGYEVIAIAMIVLGGVSLNGGKGNVLGIVLGIFFIAILWNGINIIGLSPYWKNAITGIALLFAILLDSFRSRTLGR